MRRSTKGLVATILAGVTLLGCTNHSEPPPPDKLPVTTSSPEALAAFLNGRDRLEMLRAADAREFFQQAVALDPSFALAWWGLANAAAGPSEFFSSLEKAVELSGNTSDAEAKLIRATEAGVNADQERQRQLLEELTAEYPNDERVHFTLGTFYFGQQEWEAAMGEFEKAIAIDPEYAPPYNHLGYCYRNLERYEKAETAFKKYAELVPDEPNPHDSYAELLMKIGKFGESIKEYERALEINPNFTPSYVGLGNNQILLGRTKEARNTFARLAFIARSDGERRQALTWTAASYIHEGNIDGALAEIDKRRGIALDAGDWLSVAADYNLSGFVLLGAGRKEEALASFDRAVEVIDKAYATDEVRETFRRNHLYNRARVAIARGELDDATGFADRYRAEVEQHRVAGEERAVHDLLGRIAMARGNPAEAIEQLHQANQQNPEILFLLAQAYEAAGDLDQARSYAGRAAHFNGLSFFYAFVRQDALAMLERLDRDATPSRMSVPTLPHRPRTVALA